MYSRHQNVEEGRIYVCAQFQYLQPEYHGPLANSDKFCGKTRFVIKIRLRSSILYANTEIVYRIRFDSSLHFG